jgi:hypothetical protein
VNVMLLAETNVFGARSLRTLPFVKRDGLTLVQRLEILARGLMEEPFPSITALDESKTLVSHETLDGTGA